MKLHCLNSKIDHEWRHAGELDKECEVPRLTAAGVVEAWYSYAYGSYEGAGHMIARNAEGKWGYFDLGHCSCYGPTEYLDAKGFTTDSLEELVSRMSDELRAQVAHLIEEAANVEEPAAAITRVYDTQRAKGIAQYGVPLEGSALSPSQLADYAMEEVVDAAAYILELKRRHQMLVDLTGAEWTGDGWEVPRG